MQREMSDVQRSSRGTEWWGHFRVRSRAGETCDFKQQLTPAVHDETAATSSEAWQSKNQAAFLVKLATRKVFF